MNDGVTSADEIKITPEMIRAGVDEYAMFSSQDRGEWVVAAVYRAMERVNANRRAVTLQD